MKVDAAGFGGHLDVRDEGEKYEILKIERRMVVNEDFKGRLLEL